MFPERERKKKLTVAFHFQYANQAAWRCDACRQQRLEKIRNCGFLERDENREAPVWVRGRHATHECPTSYVSAASIGWLEQFHVWRLSGKSDLSEAPAKTVEAFALLEGELLKETDHASR